VSVNLTIFNSLNLVLPMRGFFGFRCWWLRNSGLEIGGNVRISNGVRFYGSNIHIGDDTWVGTEVSVFGANNGCHIRIGAQVDLAPRVVLVSGTHELGDHSRRAGTGGGADISIGDGTWVGANTTILAGANIGAGSVVAAGSVVIAGQYPEDALLAGVPAQVKKILTN